MSSENYRRIEGVGYRNGDRPGGGGVIDGLALLAPAYSHLQTHTAHSYQDAHASAGIPLG